MAYSIKYRMAFLLPLLAIGLAPAKSQAQGFPPGLGRSVQEAVTDAREHAWRDLVRERYRREQMSAFAATHNRRRGLKGRKQVRHSRSL